MQTNHCRRRVAPWSRVQVKIFRIGNIDVAEKILLVLTLRATSIRSTSQVLIPLVTLLHWSVNSHQHFSFSFQTTDWDVTLHLSKTCKRDSFKDALDRLFYNRLKMYKFGQKYIIFTQYRIIWMNYQLFLIVLPKKKWKGNMIMHISLKVM